MTNENNERTIHYGPIKRKLPKYIRNGVRYYWHTNRKMVAVGGTIVSTVTAIALTSVAVSTLATAPGAVAIGAIIIGVILGPVISAAAGTAWFLGIKEIVVDYLTPVTENMNWLEKAINWVFSDNMEEARTTIVETFEAGVFSMSGWGALVMIINRVSLNVIAAIEDGTFKDDVKAGVNYIRNLFGFQTPKPAYIYNYSI